MWKEGRGSHAKEGGLSWACSAVAVGEMVGGFSSVWDVKEELRKSGCDTRQVARRQVL